jgi:hypothetical protein
MENENTNAFDNSRNKTAKEIVLLRKPFLSVFNHGIENITFVERSPRRARAVFLTRFRLAHASKDLRFLGKSPSS